MQIKAVWREKDWQLPIFPFYTTRWSDKEYRRTSRNIEYVQTQMFDSVFHLTNNKINAIMPPPSSHQRKK